MPNLMRILTLVLNGERPSCVCFTVLPLVLGTVSFFLSGGVYLTCDEVDMRMVLEGLAGTRASGPSPFCLYLNVLYGHVLCFFYRHFPGGCWYDVFNYLWLSVSVALIGYLSCGRSVRRNVVALILVSFMSAILFACPQFTLTASILATAGCVAGYRFMVGRAGWGWAAVSFGLVAVASLIRLEAALGAALVCGGSLFWVADCPARALLRRGVPLAALLLAGVFGLRDAGARIVAAHPEWRALAQLNGARSAFCDHMGLWGDSGKRYAEVLKASRNPPPGLNFSPEDCQMVMSFFMIGRNRVFNAENLSAAARCVRERLGVRKTGDWLRGFEDTLGVNRWRLALFLVITGLVAGGAVWRMGAGGLFLAGVFFWLMWHETRLPDRVWIGLFFAAQAAFLQMRSAHAWLSGAGRVRTLLFAVLAFSAYVLAMQGVSKVRLSQVNCRYAPYFVMRDAVIPESYRLILDICTDAPMLRPFHPFTLGKREVLFASPFAKFPDNRALARKWGIDGEDVWERVCAEDSKVRLVLLPCHVIYFTQALCRCAGAYMRARHGQSVLAMQEQGGKGVFLIRLRAIDAAERTWHAAFRKDIPRPVYQNEREIRRRAAAYAAQTPYPHANAPSLEERIWMLISSEVDERFVFSNALVKPGKQ